ncbi:MAG: QueT transporter family protein [Angelakisella sp.]
MNNVNLKRLVQGALVAAIYVVLGLALAPITFGLVQCRISEALTVLPVLCPAATWGVTLGCALTNLVGAATGANFLGLADVFLGSATTLCAALLTRWLGRYRWNGIPVLASLPPVLLNAVVIGGEWSFVTTGSLSPMAVLPFAGLIAVGQLASCCGLGLLLVWALERSGADQILKLERN